MSFFFNSNSIRIIVSRMASVGFAVRGYNFIRTNANAERMTARDTKAIGKRIKAAREKKGITQERLAS